MLFTNDTGWGVKKTVTPRAVIIGFFAIIPGIFWAVYSDVVVQTDLTSLSLAMLPVMFLLALLVVNSMLRRARPKWVLNQGELITVYSMLTVSIIVSGMGMIQFLCVTLGAVPHYKTPANGWETYLGYVPRAILPNLSAIDGFYRGGQPVPWSAWKTPILLWSGLLFSMLFSMFCINSIMRKQWVERERLTFPIVQVPLEMTDPAGRFFSNKIMWIGFAIAAGLETMNSFHFLHPNVPHLQIRAFDLAPFFTSPPWDSIGYIPTTFYPLAIGLGFLMSADLSFSCWFFFLITKLENVTAAAVGLLPPGPGDSNPGYLGRQGVGAFIGIALMALWLARTHIKEVLAKALGSAPDLDDSREPMSYRAAVAGLFFGFAVMIGFCAYIGISPLVAAAYLTIYFAFATAITRMRSEAGPAWIMQPYITALDALVEPVGSASLGAKNLVGLGYMNWFSIEMRGCPMPAQMEAMKMAQTTRVRQRALAVVLLAAIVMGIAIGFWACLAVYYEYGAGTAKVHAWRTNKGKQPFDSADALILNPTKPDLNSVATMAAGTTVTLFLGFMRGRFVWFPFHPAGYALANSGTLYWLWCPFLIAWSCKVLIVKYAGNKGYRQALPFFLGLVLGDYVASSLWALAGSVLGIRMYQCFPG